MAIPNLSGPLQPNAHLHLCMNDEPCYVENWRHITKTKLKWLGVGTAIGSSVLYILLRLLVLF